MDRNFENEYDFNLNECPGFYNNFANILRSTIREMNHLVKLKLIK